MVTITINEHNVAKVKTHRDLDISKFNNEHELIEFFDLFSKLNNDSYELEDSVSRYLYNKLGEWEEQVNGVDIYIVNWYGNGSDLSPEDIALYYFIKKNNLTKKKRNELKTLIKLSFEYKSEV